MRVCCSGWRSSATAPSGRAAAAAERARLARAVHDGVLQVLALVQRRGTELGGDLAELGRVAGEQEMRLRSLIRQQDSLTAPAPGAAGAVADLGAALERLEAEPARRWRSPRPAQPVLLPARPCRRGAWPSSGPAWTTSPDTSVRDAPAWVLLEQIGARSW